MTSASWELFGRSHCATVSGDCLLFRRAEINSLQENQNGQGHPVVWVGGKPLLVPCLLKDMIYQTPPSVIISEMHPFKETWSGLRCYQHEPENIRGCSSKAVSNTQSLRLQIMQPLEKAMDELLSHTRKHALPRWLW